MRVDESMYVCVCRCCMCVYVGVVVVDETLDVAR